MHVQKANIVQQEIFEGETFVNLRGFVAFCESFLGKIWGGGGVWFGAQKQAICKSFLAKIVFSTNL